MMGETAYNRSEASQRRILAFVKILEQREHAEQLLDGRLFMNTLGTFRELEDDSSHPRADRHEGLVAWFQPDQIELRFNDLVIPSEDLAAPVAVSQNHILSRNAYCVFSLNSDGVEEFGPEDLQRVRSKMEIPLPCYEFGSHSVVIWKPEEFVWRCAEAIQKQNFPGHINFVSYFDETTFSGMLPCQPGFAKRSRYEYQREYRIVLDRKPAEPAPFELDVGNIRDIAFLMPTKDFNAALSFNLNDGTRF